MLETRSPCWRQDLSVASHISEGACFGEMMFIANDESQRAEVAKTGHKRTLPTNRQFVFGFSPEEESH